MGGVDNEVKIGIKAHWDPGNVSEGVQRLSTQVRNEVRSLEQEALQIGKGGGRPPAPTEAPPTALGLPPPVGLPPQAVEPGKEPPTTQGPEPSGYRPLQKHVPRPITTGKAIPELPSTLVDMPSYQLYQTQLAGLKQIKDPEQLKLTKEFTKEFGKRALGDARKLESSTMKDIEDLLDNFMSMSPKKQAAELERTEEYLNRNYQALKKIRGESQTIEESMKGIGDKAERGGRMLPAYIGPAINAIGQGMNMVADLYHARRTMFDLTSPQAMANAMMERDIYETQTMWKRGSGTFGSVAGGIVGGIVGGAGTFGVGAVSGAMAGSYIGSMISEQIGSAVGTYLTADKEAQKKLFNTFFTKGQQNVQAFAPVQSLEYTLAARGFAGTGEEAGKRFAGMSSKYGVMPDELRQMALTMIESRGKDLPRDLQNSVLHGLIAFQRETRVDAQTVMGLSRVSRFAGEEFTSDETRKVKLVMDKLNISQAQVGEFLKSFPTYFEQASRVLFSKEDTGKAAWTMIQMPSVMGKDIAKWASEDEGKRRQVGQMMSGLFTPKSEAEEAFLFSSLRKAHPEDSFMQTKMRERKGLWGGDNLESYLKGISKGEEEKIIFSLSSLKDMNPELVEKFMEKMKKEGGRDEILKNLRQAREFASKKFEKDSPEYKESVKKHLGESILTGNVPLGEKAAATRAESGVEAGRKIQGYMENLATEHEKWLNAVVATTGIQDQMKAILSTTRDSMLEILKETNPKAYDEMMKKSYPGWKTEKEALQELKNKYNPDMSPQLNASIVKPISDEELKKLSASLKNKGSLANEQPLPFRLQKSKVPDEKTKTDYSVTTGSIRGKNEEQPLPPWLQLNKVPDEKTKTDYSVTTGSIRGKNEEQPLPPWLQLNKVPDEKTKTDYSVTTGSIRGKNEEQPLPPWLQLNKIPDEKAKIIYPTTTASVRDKKIQEPIYTGMGSLANPVEEQPAWLRSITNPISESQFLTSDKSKLKKSKNKTEDLQTPDSLRISFRDSEPVVHVNGNQGNEARIEIDAGQVFNVKVEVTTENKPEAHQIPQSPRGTMSPRKN